MAKTGVITEDNIDELVNEAYDAGFLDNPKNIYNIVKMSIETNMKRKKRVYEEGAVRRIAEAAIQKQKDGGDLDAIIDAIEDGMIQNSTLVS